MDAFSRELASLQLCIESLQHEETVERFPDGLKRSLTLIVRNCNDIIDQMSSLLNKLSSGVSADGFSGRPVAETRQSGYAAHSKLISLPSR